ncbi:nuclear transport factor 2 family protein [Paucibacter sp. PLA-PC-4]|uniref:nuclear transport factor 2 family protein n=1 Tax=Paucibacter sp. PLA-PC-4 TaxID=2993655 RepID=UPI00224ADB70|nr:nuclear transport factor 2 family protein [Paucibacter sp. PLA-PC-4]MCX2864465.1 nuclear transport factor 2 family protein [Paucibacter sp. PLA-PC-4]
MSETPQNSSASIVLAEQIRNIERSRLRALVAADMALARPLHAPEFQLIMPGGVAFSRDQHLGRIEQGFLRYLRWEPDAEMAVQVSGQDNAVIRYQATLAFEGSAPLRCCHIDTYERNA